MTAEQVIPYCAEHGYGIETVFNQVHIKGKYERWYFEECSDPNSKVRLMHENRTGNGWHEQFREHISPALLVRYIYEHETAKFEHFTDFHVGNDGRPRM